MANEQLSDKIENTVGGVKDFALRFIKTLLAIFCRPGALVESLSEKRSSGAFLHPNAFLLSCAIALGFLGKTLAAGSENIGTETLLQLKELTLTSFLIQTIAVFGIAIVASGAVEIALLGRSVEEKRRIKDINYYVIGFFGIGSLVVLFLLSVVLPRAPDLSGYAWFQSLAVFAIIAYVLAMFAVLQWMSGQVLRAAVKGPILTLALKASVANALVIALCILNFLSPLYRSSEGIEPIRGSLIDVELQSDGKSVGLRYLLENESGSSVAINQADDHQVFAGLRGGRIEFQGSFRKGCGLELPKQPFLLLEHNKTAIVSSCISDRRLHQLLVEAGFADTYREAGKKRLSPGRPPSPLALDLKIEVMVNGRRPGSTRIELRTI